MMCVIWFFFSALYALSAVKLPGVWSLDSQLSAQSSFGNSSGFSTRTGCTAFLRP